MDGNITVYPSFNYLRTGDLFLRQSVLRPFSVSGCWYFIPQNISELHDSIGLAWRLKETVNVPHLHKHSLHLCVVLYSHLTVLSPNACGETTANVYSSWHMLLLLLTAVYRTQNTVENVYEKGIQTNQRDYYTTNNPYVFKFWYSHRGKGQVSGVNTVGLYLTSWTLRRAPPQGWCYSCWWSRIQPSGVPLHGVLAWRHYRPDTWQETGQTLKWD